MNQETNPTTSQVEESIEAVEVTANKILLTDEITETVLVDKSQDENSVEAESVDISLFEGLTSEEIVTKLEAVLAKNSLSSVKELMDALPLIFNEIYNAEYKEKLSAYLADGGEEDGFEFTSNSCERFNALVKAYKWRKAESFKRVEEERQKNLELKLALVEELKELVLTEEAKGETFNALRDIQDRWKAIGQVPATQVSDLLENYHHCLENFYKNVKIDKELRDYDLKHNLDAKLKLCAEAKVLSESNDVASSFRVLQNLHSQWKEIGPVPFDKKETIWEEFKSYSSIINKNHQEFYESIKQEQTENLKIKDGLCEKIEKMLSENFSTVAQWNDASTIVVQAQEDWKHSGTVVIKERNKIYKRFRAACDTFFERKRSFYKGLHSEQENNLAKKIALCEKVEALKDSEDWKITTDKLIACQKEWKTIGAAPKKYSDKVWKRFRTACDEFFSRKDKHFSVVDKEYVENLEKKNALIEKIKQFELTGDNEADIATLKDFQKSWNEIGFVPIKAKNAVQEVFRKELNMWFEKLNLDENQKELERYKSKLTNFDSGDNRAFKIVNEREKLVVKIKQLELDINTLENNIGFFVNSKKSQGMLAEFSSKIEKSKQRLVLMKNKLKALDDMI